MKNLLFLFIGVFGFSGVFSQNVERYMEYHDNGRTLILQGEYEKAILYLDTAITIMPYYSTIFQDRGYAKMQLKKYDEAILDFDHVLSKKPYLSEVRLQRGMALYHLNRLNESESDLIEVLNSNPNKSREVIIYLDNIQRERDITAQQNYDAMLQSMRFQVENERIYRARHREEVIWNTVVPLAFWTTVFLTW
ncbi:hypothetical protein [Labilibaculum manganireducens]|uniref:Uncharacterized protein n=1 Tax=Labilibaculum manganireducens TaxID=1940525 RepID=A0A2N3IEF5_9BACT|nr:hypothetical protein [Labilibaculum manganireducens]PKQ68686.1 hypothetical protein BZG01_02910 [Labilibaculum manganireducens]